MKIFKAIVEAEDRPELPNTQSAILMLIKPCWKQDPALRPTFEQIYAQLASQSVAFPNSQPDGTATLIREIEEDELIVETAVRDLVNQINEMIDRRNIQPTSAGLQSLLVKAASDNVNELNALLNVYVHEIDINGNDEAGLWALHASVENEALLTVE
jgi:hypothetical protein